MRNLISALVAVGAAGALWLIFKAPGNPDGAEALARLHFEALKRNDFAHLEPILPTRADLERAAERSRQKDPKRARKIEENTKRQGGMDAVLRSGRGLQARNFAEIRELATAEDLDWPNATFEGLDDRTKIREEDGLARGTVYYRVRSGAKLHLFTLVRCGQSERGWIWTGPGRYEPLGVVASGGPGPDTIEALARLYFEALRTGELERTAVAWPTARDTQWAMDKIREAGGEIWKRVQEELRKEGGVATVAGKATKDNRKYFARTRRETKTLIDWPNARFAGLHKDSRVKPQEGPFPNANVMFWVESGGKRHLFRLGGCSKLERGWVSGRGVSYEPPRPPG